MNLDIIIDQLHNPKKSPKQLLKILLLLLGVALIILYVLPDTLALLFTTTLGNAILLLGAIYLFFYKDYRLTLLYLLCWVIVIRFIQRAHQQEGFEETTPSPSPPQQQQWTPEQIRAFTALQNLINPNINFATEQIQKYATPSELEYFMEHMTWPWSPEIEEQYKTACSQNPYISDTPDNALQHAKRIYSQGQIQQILFMQSKTGRALNDGILIKSQPPDYAARVGLATHKDPIIQCINGNVVRIDSRGTPINTNGSIGVLEHAETTERAHSTPTPTELSLANDLINGDYAKQCATNSLLYDE